MTMWRWLSLILFLLGSQLTQAEPYGYPHIYQYRGTHYGYQPPRYQQDGLTLYSHRSPFLRRHALCFLPRVTSRHTAGIRQPAAPLVINNIINTGRPAISARSQKPRAFNRQPPPIPALAKAGDLSPQTVAKPPPPENLAWRYLAAGTAKAALRHFSQEAGRVPLNGLPRIGLGISAALNGEIKMSVRAVRRAFREDPQGSAVIPVIHGISARLQRIADYFQEEAEPTKDSQFMLAAMGYFLDDEELARRSLETAIENGDESPAAKNLMALLNGEISPAPIETDDSE